MSQSRKWRQKVWDRFLLGLTVAIMEMNHHNLILSEPRQAWTTYSV